MAVIHPQFAENCNNDLLEGKNEKLVFALSGEVEEIEGTTRLFHSNGQIRKIPIPSNDPRDPLTWSTWRRGVVLISLCVFGSAGFGVVQSTPLFFSEIIPEYMRETRGVRTKFISTSYSVSCVSNNFFLFSEIRSSQHLTACQLSVTMYGHWKLPVRAPLDDAWTSSYIPVQ